MKSIVTILIVVSLWCTHRVDAQQSPDPTPNNGTHPQDEPVAQMFLFFGNDGGISGISSIPSFQCNSTIVPSVVIENFGSDELTTATLQYFVDGGAPEYYYWEGSLPPFWTDTILLPQINVTEGSHTLVIQVTEANGQLDFNGGNDGSIEFNIIGMSQPAPFSETFEQGTLPEGFFVENANSGPSWAPFTIVNAINPVRCVRMPFYTNDVAGDVDDLYMKNIDLSSVNQAELRFSVAYAYYSSYYWDELKVVLSTDCGNHWSEVYDKSKDDLATAPFTDLPFVPQPSQWRSEAVDLSDYAGNSNVIVKFEAVSGHGNNLYVDNISINDNVGIDEPGSEKTALKLFPNPASSSITVSFRAMNFDGNEINVLNSLGQSVYSSVIDGSRQVVLPGELFASGAYMVTVHTADAHYYSAPLIVFH